MTKYSYSEEVEDTEQYSASIGFRCLNYLFQTYQMVFRNFWYIEHYGARVEDDFVTN